MFYRISGWPDAMLTSGPFNRLVNVREYVTGLGELIQFRSTPVRLDEPFKAIWDIDSDRCPQATRHSPVARESEA